MINWTYKGSSIFTRSLVHNNVHMFGVVPMSVSSISGGIITIVTPVSRLLLVKVKVIHHLPRKWPPTTTPPPTLSIISATRLLDPSLKQGPIPRWAVEHVLVTRTSQYSHAATGPHTLHQFIITWKSLGSLDTDRLANSCVKQQNNFESWKIT